MRTALLLALATGALHAAVIRGEVVENQTGRPLSRAVVVAQPVTPTPGAPVPVRTNRYGQFEFPPLAGGAYVISAGRRGFPAIQYGQKHWKASGAPVEVEENGVAVLSIRMPRFGAISGTVVDENEVGLPDIEVAAYRNTRPPQLVAKIKADDCGMYRISGLEPGKYLVRTGAIQFDDGDTQPASYLPTFSIQTPRVDQAIVFEPDLDREVTNVIVRPELGRLFTIAGSVFMYPPGTVTLTLVSDTGRQSQVTGAQFQFNPSPPGQYELIATAATTTRGGLPMCGYTLLGLDRDRTDVRIPLSACPDTEFRFLDSLGQPVDARNVRVQARRKDLAGTGDPETVRITNGRATLGAGRWELMAIAPGYYVSSFSSSRNVGEPGRADGWNEILVDGASLARFGLSANPGSVRGTVTAPGDQKAVGALVFLEAWDPMTNRRLLDPPRMVRCDVSGHYQVSGLAPGDYRILSTFEYQTPDVDEMETAGARTIRIEQGKGVALDLPLYVSR